MVPKFELSEGLKKHGDSDLFEAFQAISHLTVPANAPTYTRRSVRPDGPHDVLGPWIVDAPDYVFSGAL